MKLGSRAALRAIYLAGALLLLRDSASARSHKLQQIEADCRELRNTLASATPFVFIGPDPWTEVDDVPSTMPGEALAYVYTTGPDIRWVYIRIIDAGQRWAEDINYYFRSDGTLAKRTRHLEDPEANVMLEVTSYYEDGAVVKESTHHRALSKGRQDLTNFSDPEAPVFWTVDDLPFPEIVDLMDRLT